MNPIASNNKKMLMPLSGIFILITGIIITLSVTYQEYRSLESQKKQIFDLELENILKRIQNRIELHEHALKQTRAFFLNSEFVTRDEFSSYIRDTELEKNYPGFLGIGYSEKILPENLQAHIAKVRQSGIKNYTVWPMYPREVYHSIVYLELGSEESENLLGYDMFTESVRREAMERARDGGSSIMTRKLYLASARNQQESEPALMLFAPLYIPRTAVDTLENRRQHLKGYIYSVFRARDLFSSIFEQSELKVDFEIFDSQKKNLENLIYDYDMKPNFLQKEESSFEGTKTLNIYGRNFIIYGFASSAFMSQMRDSYIWDLVGGMILTFLLTWLLCTIKKQEQESRMRADQLQVVQNNLLQTQNELHAAIKARDDFLSIASHELKNPMTAMKLQCQVLQRKLSGAINLNEHKERIEKALFLVEGQVTSLNRLIEDMLDISRLRTGQLKIITNEFDLGDLITETLNNLEEQIRNAGYPSPEVEVLGSLKGSWDKMRLEQVMYNLLINAIRYGNQRPIKIKAEEIENKIRVSVMDQGIGISKEDQQRIFDRFERATTSSESSGLGLGLFISMHIILAHHGKIWVESEEGKGSTFIFEIPK
ncbi:MAG: CHASE domain-containing protein [Bacteriovorax sp.]|jgi:signal transduction histidine kinase